MQPIPEGYNGLDPLTAQHSYSAQSEASFDLLQRIRDILARVLSALVPSLNFSSKGGRHIILKHKLPPMSEQEREELSKIISHHFSGERQQELEGILNKAFSFDGVSIEELEELVGAIDQILVEETNEDIAQGNSPRSQLIDQEPLKELKTLLSSLRPIELNETWQQGLAAYIKGLQERSDPSDTNVKMVRLGNQVYVISKKVLQDELGVKEAWDDEKLKKVLVRAAILHIKNPKKQKTALKHYLASVYPEEMRERITKLAIQHIDELRAHAKREKRPLSELIGRATEHKGAHVFISETFKLKAYQEGSVLGDGAYGVVYQVEALTSRKEKPLALKKMVRKNDDISMDQRGLELVKGIDGFIQPASNGPLWSVNAKAPNSLLMHVYEGDGVDLIKQEAFKVLSIKEKIAISLHLANALNEAHQRGVVIQDIKLENLLFKRDDAGNLHVDFGDLGSVLQKNEGGTSAFGSMSYCWPGKSTVRHYVLKAIEGVYEDPFALDGASDDERIALYRRYRESGEDFDPIFEDLMKVDVFAFGVILTQLLRKEDGKFDPRVKQLLQEVLQPLPENRPTMEHVVQRLSIIDGFIV